MKYTSRENFERLIDTTSKRVMSLCASISLIERRGDTLDIPTNQNMFEYQSNFSETQYYK